MREVVCNYAIARFRPYRETGEFVNLGVVLVCPEAGCFDYLALPLLHPAATRTRPVGRSRSGD